MLRAGLTVVFRRPGRDRGEGGRPLSGKEVVPELGTGVRDVEREKEIAQRPADDPGVRVEDEDGQAPAGRGPEADRQGPGHFVRASEFQKSTTGGTKRGFFLMMILMMPSVLFYFFLFFILNLFYFFGFFLNKFVLHF